jgi:hypothetical protein
MLTLVRFSLHSLESLAIPRLLRPHIRAAPHSGTEQTIVAMTSGSIGTSIDVCPVEEYSEKRTSGLT